jgi:hypothetical protein
MINLNPFIDLEITTCWEAWYLMLGRWTAKLKRDLLGWP